VSPLLTTHATRLAGALGDLKDRVRAALAAELAGAVGTAVRGALAGALCERLAVRTVPAPDPPAGGPRGRSDRAARDPWGDDWDDSRFALADADTDTDDADTDPVPVLTPAAVLALGALAGRWWHHRTGSVRGAIGVGAATAALGLAGSPTVRAALSALAAAADLIAAGSALAPADLAPAR